MQDAEEDVDYFSKKQVKPRIQWNELDYLCDSIQKKYGVEVIYEYTPRIIDGGTFFMPPQYEQALRYTKVVIEELWLKPLKAHFPEFYRKETPIEFILVGGKVHFNSPSTTAETGGAGLNAQFYRLGMGGVNRFSLNKDWLFEHMCILYHEHAHQIDAKYGRGILYDRVSQGKYYGVTGYLRNPLTNVNRTNEEAQADGFFEPYGGYAPEEDFATSVEFMVRYPKATINEFISKNSDLSTKYKMVHQKYLGMNIDLHDLHHVVDSVVKNLNY